MTFWDDQFERERRRKWEDELRKWREEYEERAERRFRIEMTMGIGIILCLALCAALTYWLGS